MAECGLACLAMILSSYGGASSLSQIRRSCNPSLTGMTLFQLKKTAEGFGLTTNVLRIDINQLYSLKLPCIMHWEMNHFMVVREITNNYIVVHDPARGVRTVSIE